MGLQLSRGANRRNNETKIKADPARSQYKQSNRFGQALTAMEPVTPPHFFPRSGSPRWRMIQPAVEAPPCFPSDRTAPRTLNGGAERRRYSDVNLLRTGNSPELSNEAAAAAVSNSHRQRKRMNSHPGEESINRTKQGPPRQRPERWISMLQEMFPRFVHRGFFQDSLNASGIVVKPLREQIMFRTDPARIASRPPSGLHDDDRNGGQKLQSRPQAPCSKQPILRGYDIHLVR